MNNSISVIITCYNHGAYILNTLRSIEQQIVQPEEVIIIDDGSNDKHTIEILQQVAQRKTVTVIHSANQGPAAARNIGFSNSKGEFILLIDSDDSIHESFLQKAMQILYKDPSIGVVSSWALCFGDQDYIWYPKGGMLEDFLMYTSCPSCALLRRKSWIDAQGFDETLRVGYEDWDFWIRVTKQGWLVYILPELLYYYLQKPSSRVKDTFARHEEIYRQIKRNHADIFQPDTAGRYEV